jgi:hypothetical protein
MLILVLLDKDAGGQTRTLEPIVGRALFSTDVLWCDCLKI